MITTRGVQVCLLGISLTLSGCADNPQAQQEWWGDGGGRPTYNNNHANTWNPFGNKQSGMAAPSPWSSPAGTNGGYPAGMPYGGSNPYQPSYPPPPTMPPAAYGGYEGLNPPPGSLPLATAPQMPPSGNTGFYGTPPMNNPYGGGVPYGASPPGAMPPPPDIQNLYQPQNYAPSPNTGHLPDTEASLPVERLFVSQPLSGQSGVNDVDLRAAKALQNPIPLNLDEKEATLSAPREHTASTEIITPARVKTMVSPSSASPSALAALPPPASDGVTTVYFSTNSTRLDADNDRLLKQTATLYGQAGYRLLIEGLPASGEASSVATARTQAGVVARYLISYGVPTTGVIISTAMPDKEGKGNTVTVRMAPYL
jgi:outer membrane protein OmpA-like peptidoglycan-associated protein